MLSRQQLPLFTWTAAACILIHSCTEQSTTGPDRSGSSAFSETREYAVEREPALVRNGFGMDFFHDGDTAEDDTLYLPADSDDFPYDLLFYNEFVYKTLSTGDLGKSGFPVIFLHTAAHDADSSVKAAMVGQGIAFFNAFTADSITGERINELRSDPAVDLDDFRTGVNTSTVSGSVLMSATADSLYATLAIGNKFVPNSGGVFSMDDVSDSLQIDCQPVFLIQTREGNYAKFMVTRFKGTGDDTKKLTLIWACLESTTTATGGSSLETDRAREKQEERYTF